MKYDQVCLESIGYTLPEEVISSSAIEGRLAPLYERLRLPEGRLELITGIQERRFWDPGTLPSEKSIESGEKAIQIAQLDRQQIGLLIHASVCRDHLEPATACRVHHQLGLDANCILYDVSNACLGMLNGVLQAANMIQLGQVQAALVVGTESSRALVETTIDALNRQTDLTRNQIKPALASLTIGSASCAILLTHRDISQTGNALLSAVATANTSHHELCHSGQDEAADAAMSPLMTTDSETLLREGIATGTVAFETFLAESGWTRSQIDKTICHQVGGAHRKQMLGALDLDPAHDYTTFEYLGNTGSVALPITLAVALEREQIQPADHLALLGIGSGINCLMLGVQWQRSLIAGNPDLASSFSQSHGN